MIRQEPWEHKGPTLRKTRSQLTKGLWENRNTEIWNQQVAGELRRQHAMTIRDARTQDMKLPRNGHDEINRLRFRSWSGRRVVRHTPSNEHSLLPFQSGGNWYRHADSTEQNQNMTVFWIQRWENKTASFTLHPVSTYLQQPYHTMTTEDPVFNSDVSTDPDECWNHQLSHNRTNPNTGGRFKRVKLLNCCNIPLSLLLGLKTLLNYLSSSSLNCPVDVPLCTKVLNRSNVMAALQGYKHHHCPDTTDQVQLL